MNRIMMGALGALLVTASGCTTVIVTPPPPNARAVAVMTYWADKNADRLAMALDAAVENRLAERGFYVASELPTNATVTLMVSRREAARLDDWRTYEGTAQVRVMTAGPMAKLLADRTFTAVGMRALDEVKAEQSVVDGLSRQVNAWLDRIVTEASIPALPPPAPAK